MKTSINKPTDYRGSEETPPLSLGNNRFTNKALNTRKRETLTSPRVAIRAAGVGSACVSGQRRPSSWLRGLGLGLIVIAVGILPLALACT